MNRGSHPTIGGPGVGGNGGGGSDGGAGGQTMMPDGSQDQVVADTGVDAVDNCDLDGGADAGDAGPPSSCTAMFNFESPAGCGLYMATLGENLDNPAATAGFTGLHHAAIAACGRGSMAIDVDFNLDTRTGGEVIIPISQSGTASFTGKTFSFSLMGSADGGNARFYVYLIANGQFQPVVNVPITTTWQSYMIPLPVPDAGASSADNVMSISLEAFGRGATYKGTIYVDEIDVRSTVDAGASDGSPADVPATDARDGGATDVRDAPAGS